MKYTSKQVQILHPDHLVFNTMSSFEHLTPVLADRVKGWKAEGDRCQFEVQGIKLGFRFAELTPSSTIKLAGDDSATPFPFTMWFQIKDASQGATHSAADAAQAKIEADTRMRIVLDVELNTMMKMMIGGKIQQAIDGIADQIAHAFNQAADHQLTPQLTTIAG